MEIYRNLVLYILYVVRFTMAPVKCKNLCNAYGQIRDSFEVKNAPNTIRTQSMGHEEELQQQAAN
jgi:hypothetical protein